MEGIPELLDLVVAVLRTITVLFLAYGAYLAICKTEGLQIAGELVSTFRAPARDRKPIAQVHGGFVHAD